MSARTILIMAAGSGGHIFPGLAIARELQSRGWSIHWMGTPAGMENKLVAQAGYPLSQVNMTGVRGKGAMAWLVLPMRILAAFWQAFRAIRRIRPDVVLSMGGYVAFPGGMMAALLGRPLIVHEPGAVAGITNRVLAPVADRVIVGLQGAFDRPVAQKWAGALPKPSRTDWLGTPVRDDITALSHPDQRYAGRSEKLRLLVVGGSLGAQTMNDLVLAALASMHADERPDVVHQSGEKLYEGLQAAYAKAGVAAEVLPFVNDMAARYAWCDVLICRSGAITVAEIAAAGIASILFPLPWFVADEQAANAAFLAERGAGIALRQLETQPQQLAEILRGLDRHRLAEMARKARALGKPDATRRCADVCMELAHAA
ncbi:MAG TPA: undecaprenyldiphospho-muramoylpentapeptide beta-N-acetylglucosaminyltransferase [Usitatibacter sp.]|nr:undecaprenyldiphospho-muramoylpentapeptide beta-N-acetylglucosaminyltransferase [Usitatibacter sp.]